METIFGYADKYLKQSTWKDLALIKFCLCAVGVLWGMALPKKAHKPAVLIAVSVFICTYIPLMLKLFKVMKHPQMREVEE